MKYTLFYLSSVISGNSGQFLQCSQRKTGSKYHKDMPLSKQSRQLV